MQAFKKAVDDVKARNVLRVLISKFKVLNCQAGSTSFLVAVNYRRLPKKMYFLLFNIAILFINICATAIVGTYVLHTKGCRTGLNSKYQKASNGPVFFKIDRPFLVLANFPITWSSMILLLINTFHILINCTLFITVTINSLYFPLVVLLFISPPWKLLLFKLVNLSTKRIRLHP